MHPTFLPSSSLYPCTQPSYLPLPFTHAPNLPLPFTNPTFLPSPSLYPPNLPTFLFPLPTHSPHHHNNPAFTLSFPPSRPQCYIQQQHPPNVNYISKMGRKSFYHELIDYLSTWVCLLASPLPR
ncbi:hypothetical protein Pcinc_018828 [Petrolisthes cinctipes]|uniref:Uncharacterized protein n=1 Tax=Petrolisthes cinctipes TaxID=88211 RepID=A0AAE1FMY8_PETCI|nr:hypothetical protein Pcinc_018828 [Petrolisthes cinctipes]